MGGGRAIGRGDVGERVLLKDKWESLESENRAGSEEKLGRKVQDGKVIGSEA
jgi:hypothetical protein